LLFTCAHIFELCSALRNDPRRAGV